MQFANTGSDQPAHLLTESVDTVVYVHEQRILRSDCTDVQSVQGLCCQQIALGPFL